MESVEYIHDASRERGRIAEPPQLHHPAGFHHIAEGQSLLVDQPLGFLVGSVVRGCVLI